MTKGSYSETPKILPGEQVAEAVILGKRMEKTVFRDALKK